MCAVCVCVVVVVVVVVQMIHDTASLSWCVRMMQLIRVAEHLGASPASPPPLSRPDGGGTPGRVPVYTAKKANPSTDEQHLWSCTTRTSTTCVAAPLRPLPFNLN